MSILKPKIVFDINEEWNVSRLSDIGIKVKEKNKNYEYDQVLTNSASQGVVLQSDYFEKSIANTNNINGYYVVRVNDFVYNPRISNDAPVGPISRNTLTDGVMSPLYTVFRVKSINLEFLDQYFKSNHWHKYMKSVANYGARHDRMAISSNDFINLPIKHPSLPKQQKIADFLTAVDKRIELLEKKKTLLETYKKGLMKKIFNQDIRFKDDNGNYFPDWEEKRLDEISKFRRGSFPQPYGLPEWYDDINGIPFVQVYDVGENFKLKSQTKQKISFLAQPKSVFVPKESILITIQGSIGRVAITQYDSYVDRTLLIFTKLNENLNKYFFVYQLYRLFDIEKRRAPGGTIKTITKEKLSSFTILIPDVVEQLKISNFLFSIDKQLEILDTQIDKSKTWKKGLLQKMFV